MQTTFEVEIFAIAVGVEGSCGGVGQVSHHLEIVTETDILYLPVIASILFLPQILFDFFGFCFSEIIFVLIFSNFLNSERLVLVLRCLKITNRFCDDFISHLIYISKWIYMKFYLSISVS